MVLDGVREELEAVVDPSEQASDRTETLLRTNPFTGPVAGISDAIAFSRDGEIDNPTLDEDSTADTAFDVIWSGHDGDSVDVVGPAVFGEEGSVADVLTQVEGEETSTAEMTTSLLLLGGVVLVVVWIVAPILGPLLEALLGDEDE